MHCKWYSSEETAGNKALVTLKVRMSGKKEEVSKIQKLIIAAKTLSKKWQGKINSWLQ